MNLNLKINNIKISTTKKLNRRFFNQSTLKVAEALLGKILVFKDTHGIITETEAYMGFDDPASHAAKGKTKRTELMFGPPGFSYVYLIYGMYHCLNIVTEKKDFPAAVLIRGLKLLQPIISNKKEISSKNKDIGRGREGGPVSSGTNIILNGPGKICRHLGITKDHNGIDIINSDELYVTEPQKSIKLPYITTSRVGIRVGQDKMWRFLAKDCTYDQFEYQP